MSLYGRRMRQSNQQKFPQPHHNNTCDSLPQEAASNREDWQQSLPVTQSPLQHVGLVTYIWIWVQEKGDLCSKLVMDDEDTWIGRPSFAYE